MVCNKPRKRTLKKKQNLQSSKKNTKKKIPKKNIKHEESILKGYTNSRKYVKNGGDRGGGGGVGDVVTAAFGLMGIGVSGAVIGGVKLGLGIPTLVLEKLYREIYEITRSGVKVTSITFEEKYEVVGSNIGKNENAISSDIWFKNWLEKLNNNQKTLCLYYSEGDDNNRKSTIYTLIKSLGKKAKSNNIIDKIHKVIIIPGCDDFIEPNERSPMFDYTYYDYYHNKKVKYYVKGDHEETIKNTIYDIQNGRRIGGTQSVAHDNMGKPLDDTLFNQPNEHDNYTKENRKTQFNSFNPIYFKENGLKLDDTKRNYIYTILKESYINTESKILYLRIKANDKQLLIRIEISNTGIDKQINIRYHASEKDFSKDAKKNIYKWFINQFVKLRDIKKRIKFNEIIKQEKILMLRHSLTIGLFKSGFITHNTKREFTTKMKEEKEKIKAIKKLDIEIDQTEIRKKQTLEKEKRDGRLNKIEEKEYLSDEERKKQNKSIINYNSEFKKGLKYFIKQIVYTNIGSSGIITPPLKGGVNNTGKGKGKGKGKRKGKRKAKRKGDTAAAPASTTATAAAAAAPAATATAAPDGDGDNSEEDDDNDGDDDGDEDGNDNDGDGDGNDNDGDGESDSNRAKKNIISINKIINTNTDLNNINNQDLIELYQLFSKGHIYDIIKNETLSKALLPKSNFKLFNDIEIINIKEELDKSSHKSSSKKPQLLSTTTPPRLPPPAGAAVAVAAGAAASAASAPAGATGVAAGATAAAAAAAASAVAVAAAAAPTGAAVAVAAAAAAAAPTGATAAAESAGAAVAVAAAAAAAAAEII
jgi:hypothetical protein